MLGASRLVPRSARDRRRRATTSCAADFVRGWSNPNAGFAKHLLCFVLRTIASRCPNSLPANLSSTPPHKCRRAAP
jgi:hypothetical protein